MQLWSQGSQNGWCIYMQKQSTKHYCYEQLVRVETLVNEGSCFTNPIFHENWWSAIYDRSGGFARKYQFVMARVEIMFVGDVAESTNLTPVHLSWHVNILIAVCMKNDWCRQRRTGSPYLGQTEKSWRTQWVVWRGSNLMIRSKYLQNPPRLASSAAGRHHLTF